MRTSFHALVVFAVAAAALLSSLGSSAAAQSSASTKKPPKVISLSGCVQRDEHAPQQFVISDSKEGTYRLSGKDFREYLGRRVTLDGGIIVKGFAVRGGLTPNPNVAAQAGAIDPARAAVQAATTESGTGVDTGLPEFRVKKIQTGSGPCQ